MSTGQRSSRMHSFGDVLLELDVGVSPLPFSVQAMSPAGFFLDDDAGELYSL